LSVSIAASVATVESGQPTVGTFGPFFIPVLIFCFGVVGYLFLYVVNRVRNGS
jgi:hypothetical protein